MNIDFIFIDFIRLEFVGKYQTAVKFPAHLVNKADSDSETPSPVVRVIFSERFLLIYM